MQNTTPSKSKMARTWAPEAVEMSEETQDQSQYHLAVKQLIGAVELLEDSLNRAIERASKFVIVDPRQPIAVSNTGAVGYTEPSKSPATKEIEEIAARVYNQVELAQRFGSFLDS